MKKLIALVLFALLMLTSCRGEKKTPVAAPTAQTPAAEKTTAPEEEKLALFSESKPVCQVVMGARAKWMTEDATTSLRSSLASKTKNQVTFNYDAHITPGLVPIYVGTTTSEISKKLSASLARDEIGVLIENGEIAICAGIEDYIGDACNLFRKKLLSSGIKAGSLTVPARYSVVEKISEKIPELPHFDGADVPTLSSCGDGFFLFNYTGTPTGIYLSYLEKLESAGFEKKAEKDFGGNLYATYSDGETDVHLSHMRIGEYTKVVAGPASPLVPVETGEYDENAKVEVGVLGLKNFGLSMAIKLKDGKFIMIDGGQQDGAKVLVEYLEANVPEGEKPVVAAWIFTHAHPDHTYGVYGLQQNNYFTRVTVERFVFNFPSSTVYEHYEPACVAETKNVLDTINDFFPDAEIIKPHTGNQMVLGGVTVDFVSTQEDVLPGRINDFNDTSMVMKFTVDGATMLVTGDMSVGDFAFCNGNISNEALKCDVLQFAHHGGNNNSDFYGAVDPEIVIIPNNDPSSYMSFLTRDNSPIKPFGEKALRCYSNVETVTFPLPYDESELPPSHYYTVK
ncbi:MAG: hypothetical protein IJV00_04790 [Clostridia bacterium]|nr:hypothetical protein [Clostridia bacterium]